MIYKVTYYDYLRRAIESIVEADNDDEAREIAENVATKNGYSCIITHNPQEEK